MCCREGPKSLFRGNGINLLIQAPFSAFEFYFYELYKNNLFGVQRREDLSFVQKFVSGGLAGMTAACIIYPMDVTKTHLTIST